MLTRLPLFRNIWILSLSVLLLANSFLSCRPEQDSEVMVPPAYPPVFDTLLGYHAGNCFHSSRYLDFSTGQWIVDNNNFACKIHIYLNEDATGIKVQDSGVGETILFSSYKDGDTSMGWILFSKCFIDLKTHFIQTSRDAYAGSGETHYKGEYYY